MRIYLIGFMGSGKSTGGKKLAAKLNLPLIDIDKTIEAIEGCRVSEIFLNRGEEYFRKMEQSILKDTLLHDDAIISCGGGTPCFFDNMDWMKQNGLTLYLNCSTGFLFRRLQQKKAKRPLIANMNDDELKTYIADKLKEREPYYNKADIKFSSEDIDIDALAAIINTYIK